MSDNPLDVYVLHATDMEQKFIKVADDGCLAIFDDEASAKRAKRRNPDTDYKQVNYYSQRQVDHMQDRIAELEAELQAARAQGGQGAEPIGWVHKKHLRNLDKGQPVTVYHADTPVVFDSKVPVYTHPQPAVPEGWRAILEEALAMMTSQPMTLERQADAVTGVRSLLSTPTTPQADGWVRCEDRLPEPRRQSRKKPNGILVKFSNGRVSHFREVTETLVTNMKNGPRQVLKFETPKPPRIVEWLDLDSPQPPKEGEGDE